MFKKAFTIKSKNVAGQKDKKILAQRCEKELGISEDALWSKEQKVSVFKVNLAHGKASIYCNTNGDPVLVDSDFGLFTTLYVCWSQTLSLPHVLIHPYVSRFILRGADIMRPGLICYPGFFDLKVPPAQLVLVRTLNNRFPFAIGKLASDLRTLEHTTEGKAVIILHIFGDCIWQLGCKIVPHESFTVTAINPVTSDSPAYIEDLIPSEYNFTATCDGWDEEGECDSKKSDELSNTELEKREDQQSDCAPSFSNKIEEEPQECEIKSVSVATHNLTNAQMDAIITFLFLEALHLVVPDTVLPLDISGLNSKINGIWDVVAKDTFELHKILQYAGVDKDMLNSILDDKCNITFDVKQSSFKKFSKVVSHFAKLKVLQIKEARSNMSIVKVNRDSPIYLKHQKSANIEKCLNSPQTPAHPVVQNDVSKKACPKFSVEKVYFQTQKTQPIFSAVGIAFSKSQHMNRSVCEEILTKYCEDVLPQNLPSNVKPVENGIVSMDMILGNILVKKTEIGVSSLSRRECSLRFLESLKEGYMITSENEEKPIIGTGPVPVINILVISRMRGKKHITNIRNLSTFNIELNGFCDFLQKKLATSASITNVPGGNEHGVIIQGKVHDTVSKILQTEYGIPKSCIKTEIK